MHTQNGMLEGRTVLYTPKGTIKAIQYFRRDTLDGVQYTFYPSENPLTWERARLGQLNGPSYGFYENGTVSFTRHMRNGLRIGPYRLYYETPHRLHVAIDFLVVEGEEYQNSYVAYDSLGRLTARTGTAQIRAEHDTVPLGGMLALHLRVRNPEFPLVAAVFGDFDGQFHLRDPASQRYVPGHDHAVTLQVPALRRGQQVVRGYLADFRETGRQPGSTGPLTESQVIYFTYPYFVR